MEQGFGGGQIAELNLPGRSLKIQRPCGHLADGHLARRVPPADGQREFCRTVDSDAAVTPPCEETEKFSKGRVRLPQANRVVPLQRGGEVDSLVFRIDGLHFNGCIRRRYDLKG